MKLVKHSHVQTYRAKASQLNESQWEALLLSVLLRHASEKAAAVEAIEKLETTATITKEKLLIIFRKNISGITQRLGEIPLGKDEDQEIDSIGWAGTAAVRSTDLEKEVEDLKGKNSEQKNVIGKLNQQLQDLIEAKIQHEKDLLEKFRELLNAKKLKIRDLHRVLAGAKIAPQKGQSPYLFCSNFPKSNTCLSLSQPLISGPLRNHQVGPQQPHGRQNAKPKATPPQMPPLHPPQTQKKSRTRCQRMKNTDAHRCSHPSAPTHPQPRTRPTTI